MKITIYLNKEKTSIHVIRPTEEFKGDHKGLVETIAPNNCGYVVHKTDR